MVERDPAGPFVPNATRCRVHPAHACWDCRVVYREMAARQATGATIHALNNEAMCLAGACEARDSLAYARHLRRFVGLLRRGYR